MKPLVGSIGVTLLLAGTLLSTTNALECYSCSTDDSDLDCDNLAVLEKTTCQPFSAINHPVQPVCGYKRLIPSSSESPERVWRGCGVSGECALLSQQGSEAFNSVFRMSACEECQEDNCNGGSSGNGGTRAPISGWTVCLAIIGKVLSITVARIVQ